VNLSRRDRRAQQVLRSVIGVTLFLSGAPRPAHACDVCAIYTATALQETRSGFWAGIAEQFTRFDTTQIDAHQVENPGEYVNSSTTQVLLGYNFDEQWTLQLTVPFVARDFRRLHDGLLEKGNVGGIGDASLLARYNAFSHTTANSILRLSVLGGLKYPTGDPDDLKEPPDADAPAATSAGSLGSQPPRLTTGRPPPRPHHEEGDPSGIHGHDLALGSGSLDGILGATLFWSYKRLFASGAVQYKITTEGAHDYQFANELSYWGGPGLFVLLQHAYTMALQAEFSGESKGTDTQGGSHDPSTGITALYAGPRIMLTYKRSLQADLGGALPVVQNNTGLQLVPDYRIHGGLIWRF
jgi:hypothetical protein